MAPPHARRSWPSRTLNADTEAHTGNLLCGVMKTGKMGISVVERRRLAMRTVILKVRVLLAVSALGMALGGTGVPDAQVVATDPGVRGGPQGAGGRIAGLTPREMDFFAAGQAEFQAVEDVAGGLGPRMNLDSCTGWHSQPVTPQVAFASKNGGTDQVPFFIKPNGPVREARFKFNPDGTRDGGVHNTATLTGRTGAAGCVLALPDFAAQAANNNLIFRIPTPVFGAGLLEEIPDSVILANQAAAANTNPHP